MVVFDNITKTVDVVAMARLDLHPGDPDAAYQDAASRVDELVSRLAKPPADLAPADIDRRSEEHTSELQSH